MEDRVVKLQPRELYDPPEVTELLSSDPLEGLDLVDDPAARPIEDFLPQDEQEDWKQRLRELGEKERRSG